MINNSEYNPQESECMKTGDESLDCTCSMCKLPYEEQVKLEDMHLSMVAYEAALTGDEDLEEILACF